MKAAPVISRASPPASAAFDGSVGDREAASPAADSRRRLGCRVASLPMSEMIPERPGLAAVDASVANPETAPGWPLVDMSVTTLMPPSETGDSTALVQPSAGTAPERAS